LLSFFPFSPLSPWPRPAFFPLLLARGWRFPPSASVLQVLSLLFFFLLPPYHRGVLFPRTHSGGRNSSFFPLLSASSASPPGGNLQISILPLPLLTTRPNCLSPRAATSLSRLPKQRRSGGEGGTLFLANNNTGLSVLRANGNLLQNIPGRRSFPPIAFFLWKRLSPR